MEQTSDLKSIPSAELLHRLFRLVRQSRRVEAELVAHIGEVDARRLYLGKAKPSMHKYCTEVLGVTDSEAYLRVTAARTSRKFPSMLAMLADGRLHVSGIERLAPSLTRENHEALFERAAHKTRRQIEELVADLAPKPDAPAVMRKLPQARNHTKAPGGSQVRLDGPGRLAPGARPGPPDSPGGRTEGFLPPANSVQTELRP